MAEAKKVKCGSGDETTCGRVAKEATEPRKCIAPGVLSSTCAPTRVPWALTQPTVQFLPRFC